MLKAMKSTSKSALPGMMLAFLLTGCMVCGLFIKALVDPDIFDRPQATAATRKVKPVRTPKSKRRSTQAPASWLCPSEGPPWIHYTGMVAAYVGSVDSIEYYTPNSIAAQQILPDRRVCYGDIDAVEQHTSTGTFVMVFDKEVTK